MKRRLILSALIVLVVPAVVVAQTLTWDDPDGAAVAGFTIWRAPGTVSTPITCGTFVQIASIAGTLRTHRDADPSITPGTAWCYQVQAFNALVTSAFSNIGTFSKPLSAPALVTVTVSASGGGGGGTVASTPAGILCYAGQTCTTEFPEWTKVTLTQTARHNGSRFVTWGGACAGTSLSCVVTAVTGETTVTAEFVK